MRTKIVSEFFLSAAAALILIAPIMAQTPTGQITGTVTDSSGASVSGAKVTLNNPATNLQRVVNTNQTGLYDVPALPPGRYTLKVEMQGFNAQIRTDVDLQVSQVARMDVILQVGDVAEVIEVSGGAQMIQTDDAAVGTVIENRRILELPLNGRNYLQLAALTPGVTTNSAPAGVGNTRQGGTRAEFTLSVAGQRIHLNHYSLDGIENTDPNFNSFLFLPSLDALQEFKVESGIFPAEYGHNMSQVNVTTKSGTKDVHGTLFEFVRNAKLDAKNFFDRANDPIPPFKRNQFGFTLGGPVVIPRVLESRDKLFFLVNYEGLRERKALTRTSTLPSASYRAGDFSADPTVIYDPDSRTYAGNVVTGAMPFAGNRVPVSRIQGISSTYLERFVPLPNLNPNVVANNYLNTEGRRTNANQETARFDYLQSQSSMWMVRYSHSGEFVYNPGELPAQGTNIETQAHQGVIGHTAVIGASKVNELKLGISRLENANIQPSAGSTNVVGELGIVGIPTGEPLYWGVPRVQIGGGITAVGDNPDVPFSAWNTIIQASDNFMWTRGRHSIKFGADIRRTRFNALSGTVVRGRFSWGGAYTTSGLAGARTAVANNMADYLLGLFSQTENQIGLPIANFRSLYAGLYIQDSWRVTSRLTVNYGLRWENDRPYHDKHDAIVNIDYKWDFSAFPTFVRAGTGDPFEGNPAYPLPSFIPYVRDGRFGRTAYKNDPVDFAPRLGIAYSVTPKTVIRTGFGIFYVRDIGTGSYEVVRNAPFTIRNGELANASRPNLTWAHPFTTTNIPSFLLAAEWNESTAYVPQWSFGFQRQLTNDLSLEVNYLGSAGVHLRRLVHYNSGPPGPGNSNARRPYPVFNGLIQSMNASAHASYNSLQTRLQQRFSHGFTLLSSFSYGKSIDNASGVREQGGDGFAAANPYDLRAERGLSAFDFRKRWTNSLLFELPFGKGKALLGGSGRLANALIGGWQAGSVLTLQDGFHITPGCASAGTVQNTGTSCRSDASGVDPHLPRGQQDPRRFFNTDAFVQRLPGGDAFRYGNASRSTVPTPGIISWDFSLNKNFKIRETHKLEFRTEFFNLPNHPIFGAPGATAGATGYGVVSGTRIDSRQLQFGLKYVF